MKYGADQPVASAATEPPAPVKPSKKWRRRVAWSSAFILCLLLLTVAFAPALASTSVGRRLILSQLNHRIGGTIEIADWSIHWRGGIDLRNLCLYDPQHVPVLTIARLHTDLSLWNALHHQYQCGQTSIDGVDLTHLVIHKDGSTNLQQIIKNEPSTKPSHVAHRSRATSRPAEPNKLPIVSGDFHVTHLTGAILHDRLKGSIIIDPSDAHWLVTDLKQPITEVGNVALRMQPFASIGTVHWNGQIQLTDDGRIDMVASHVETALAFDHFEGGGIELQKVDVNLHLANGILRTEPLIPIQCNGGNLDLRGLSVDWHSGEPRLVAPANYVLVKDASINPLLGDSLGKYVNPIFTNSRRAQGKLDITLTQWDSVALNAAIKTEQSGTFTATFNLHDMNIVNPLGSQMISAVRKSSGINLAKVFGVKTTTKRSGARDADVFDGQIENATAKLQRGRIDEDITLQLTEASDPARAAQPMLLRFVGEVKLHDLSQKLDVTLPAHFVSRSIGNRQFAQVLDDLFPDGIPISLRGTTKSPKLDISRSIVRYQKNSNTTHPSATKPAGD